MIARTYIGHWETLKGTSKSQLQRIYVGMKRSSMKIVLVKKGDGFDQRKQVKIK